MKITVTGSLGNISKRLTEQLVKKGHAVTVITHNAEKAAAIEELGATPAVGSLYDYDFVVKSFTDADAVYVMIPPNSQTDDLKGEMKKLSDIYARAIEATGVKYVANLSGIGAQSPEGNGPSSAFFYSEGRLNQLEDVNVLHLRPGMFYTNQHGSINMIKRMGFMGNNFDASTVIAMTHPHDIADAAAEALDAKSFNGKAIQYVVSDELTGGELASTLGAAFGNPDLPWVVLTDDQVKQGIVQGGFSQHMAENFAEMGRSIADGKIWDLYYADKANNYGKLKFADFAQQLAAIYN
ncbi:hypothetical protein AMR72_04055 [Flavobacterium psychrophilum]|nr:hypothetical protein AMR72_04055 [Flavobacterium psychrophilum]AOE51759.1 hypothetical protein ALW18_04050 [Flavobacterium psychrophilum]